MCKIKPRVKIEQETILYSFHEQTYVARTTVFVISGNIFKRIKTIEWQEVKVVPEVLVKPTLTQQYARAYDKVLEIKAGL